MPYFPGSRCLRERHITVKTVYTCAIFYHDISMSAISPDIVCGVCFYILQEDVTLGVT